MAALGSHAGAAQAQRIQLVPGLLSVTCNEVAAGEHGRKEGTY